MTLIITFHSFSSIIYPSNDYDYIGNKSCIALQTKDNLLSNIDHKSLASSNENKMKSYIRSSEKKREFPPTMPWLTQTKNLASHIPYMLKRYYTDEGRLIIKEEKVKYHEYFHAHRENARLTLQLIPLGHVDDDNDYFMDTYEQDEEVEEEEEINNVTMDGDFEEESMNNTQKNVVVGDDEVVVENENEIVRGANNKGNYLKYNKSVLSSSPSGVFGVLPLQPIRIVHG
ncbi:hypothetical protein RYX36_006991 [Vicia faba]